jgi:hypothetical protein
MWVKEILQPLVPQSDDKLRHDVGAAWRQTIEFEVCCGVVTTAVTTSTLKVSVSAKHVGIAGFLGS